MTKKLKYERLSKSVKHDLACRRSEIDGLKAKVAQTAKDMYRQRLVTFTWGNVSARVPQSDFMIITPSGLEYEKLNPDDMVVVDLENKIVEGHYKPSVETPMHASIYQHRPDVHGIVHTHSPYATALAVTGQELPPIWAEQAAVLGGRIPITRYVPLGTRELGQEVIKILGKKPAVLLQNHGLVAVGPNLEEAFRVACSVEEAAHVYIMGSIICKPIEIPEEDVLKLYTFYRTKYGQK